MLNTVHRKNLNELLEILSALTFYVENKYFIETQCRSCMSLLNSSQNSTDYMQTGGFSPCTLFPDLLPPNPLADLLTISSHVTIETTMSPQDPLQRCRPQAAAVDEAADPGGRPRFVGADGCTGSAPVCGLRRSTEIASSLSPTCSRNTFSPRSRTA